ncbi:hypothetical protein J8273_0551 [Carpediemonas membranifera]|nr:hypothetical protein J8273_0551 [Carpediemonas membranifera]|eukprot:KAG9395318.1 hypothetical protein J8273_0551 [Carpediemonas membranifera]
MRDILTANGTAKRLPVERIASWAVQVILDKADMTEIPMGLSHREYSRSSSQSSGSFISVSSPPALPVDASFVHVPVPTEAVADLYTWLHNRRLAAGRVSTVSASQALDASGLDGTEEDDVEE